MERFRIGNGYDVHALAAGLPLVLGGVRIESPVGCVAHSDGDVAIHALCDALLGALALGDIGQHFPDSSDEFKGIDSLLNYGSYVILGLFVLYGGLSAAKLPLLVLLTGTLFSSVNAVFTWWLERAEYQAACQRLNWMQREDGSETPEEPMLLSCTGVEKAFGDKRILSGISLDILRGEHVLLQGKNGSGKSTLLRILLGLERADAGVVLRCSDLSYALQEEAQTTLTVGELTEQLDKTPGMDSNALHRHLVGFQLTECMDQPLAQLSGGQQKRFFLAAALAKASQLLVLDEPTNHLDRESVVYLTQVLQEYPGAMLVCSHTSWTALRWDKIIHMQGGVIGEE